MRATFKAERTPAGLVAAGLLAGVLGVAVLAARPAEIPDRLPDAGPETAPAAAPSWEEVDRLISEQKMEAARAVVAELRTAARAAGDDDEVVRAIVRETQLRMALHGYETAVRFLREEPWPESGSAREALDLAWAHALATYHRAYSWEIQSREEVVGTETVDLQRWTSRQIVAEVHRSMSTLWAARGEWGNAPLGPLAEFIDQNDYPPRIRGTLRDTISYLWADVLADTSLWGPRESNQLYRLDLETLLEGTDADPSDPDLHPLERIAAVLQDLEAWHLGQVRLEAALEARLTLLRTLAGSFTSQEEMNLLKANLRRSLDRVGRNYEWWSSGMALLAEWTLAEDTADASIRAREIALEGSRSFTESVGARRCAHLVASIEAPGYSLEAMTRDGAGKRSIEVTHRNLKRLFFRAYRLDLARDVLASRDRNLRPGWHEVEAILAERTPEHAWFAPLPSTPDYRSHRTFVTPPMSRSGLYVVIASSREDFGEAANQRAAILLSVGDLVLLSRIEEGGVEAAVVSGSSGAARAGATVELWVLDYRKGHRRVASRNTDETGRARFSLPDSRRQGHFLVVRAGDESIVEERIHSWYRGPETDPGVKAALVYTDRSVYRPGQEMLWKVVAYSGSGSEGSYAVDDGVEVEVELLDPNGETVARRTVTTNSFGSASGRFEIPTGRLLGGWSIRARDNWAHVAVEEYKRPTFEIELLDPEAPIRLNDVARIVGETRYYFGLPVVAADVDWRVTRQPHYPWWWHGGYPGGRDAEVVASGSGETDAEGRFEIEFTPEADPRLAGERSISYRYRLDVEVTDQGGETRSGERSFRVGFVALEATIEPSGTFVPAEVGGSLEVRRADLQGVGRPGKGSWRLTRLQEPAAAQLPADLPAAVRWEEFATPGDRLQPRWTRSYDPMAVLRTWEDGPEVSAGQLDHDEGGLGRLELPSLDAGAYRVHYETEDDFGERLEVAREIVVLGSAGRGVPVAAILGVDRRSASVGDTLQVAADTGLSDQPLTLELFQAGRRIELLQVGAAAGARILEIPIEHRHRGGFSLALTAVRDHQLVRLTESVFVPWDDKELVIEFSTFRDLLRPGQKETWSVTVTAGEQRLASGSAELLAYMYDRSLDLFAAHQPPSVLALYPHRAWEGLPPETTLGSRGQIWRSASYPKLPGYPGLDGDRLKVYDRYGIGGPGRRQETVLAMAEAVSREAVSHEDSAPVEETFTVVSESPLLREEGQGGDLERPDAPLRTDFSETGFWEPHLLTGPDGGVTFEFAVPDSVTEWNVFVHAMTRDLRGGSVAARTRSAKDIMVRPYLPRFLRSGDAAELAVTVQNATEETLSGSLDFDIVDPESGASLLTDFGLAPDRATNLAFSVDAGQATTLRFPVRAPSDLGAVAVRARATAGAARDGEQRALPILPSRVHLSQSRFAALDGADRRELEFADMRGPDDTLLHDRLVVTLDGQLFLSILRALPYLVEYPYECTEQALNRYLSSGILSALYEKHPEVAAMAAKLSGRDTPLEPWAGVDPNRKIALEETPWLVAARGGDTSAELIDMLDSGVVSAQRTASLAKLVEAQTALGGFPWWPGGPPSPYMTLYILYGFSKGLEFGVDAPRGVVESAWAYLQRHYVTEILDGLEEGECCVEFVTFLNYVLSSYPDAGWTGGVFSADDSARMLDTSFAHWRDHSPLLKGYLALTLERSGRGEEARLVFDSLMDSAKSSPDLGTYWAPEERAWLWYNDTIEGHAFALRALTELDPDDPRRKGLVQWLFLNKKLNHWKSTRATAEVLYSVAHYLESEGELGAAEAATVRVGPIERDFVFSAEGEDPGTQRLVIEGDEVDSQTMSVVEVEKETPGLMFASATWHFSTERVPNVSDGDLLAIERHYFRRVLDGEEWRLEPLRPGTGLSVGDQVEVHLSVRAGHAAEYVHLRDPRAAGLEPETVSSRFQWDAGLAWYEEIRDSGTNFFFEWLPAGEYNLRYRLRAATAGEFTAAPATLQSMYAPEFTAYSAGARLGISGR